jgi:meso-butanediol dehydrogenase/(S,S)-butanediol dehydrogenase/diacetyl reductase
MVESTHMERLAGRRALVTGGTSGIGAAVARRLAAEGAKVVLTGRSAARGAEVAAEVGGTFVTADVRDPGDVERSVAAAVETLGGLDIAVLNAGVLHDAPLSETSDEAWDSIVETNLLGPYRYACAVMPHLARSTDASIVVMASDAGVWVEESIAAYSVSKRGAIMLAKMLAVEGGPKGVRCSAVCPGDTEPGMVTTTGGRDALPDTSGWGRPPLGRLVHADDVAAAVAFLVSADGRNVNGAELLIDGGMRAALRANQAWRP